MWEILPGDSSYWNNAKYLNSSFLMLLVFEINAVEIVSRKTLFWGYTMCDNIVFEQEI